ncbi:helicase/secretion neighborhood TadE-like protein [Corynebacterium mycetoides]|uniref:Helicase/secretion neighborhood TadE-like protein n=1 Tax=Corynebacterium mycetoides TaxID=38302 RepID=A0A1G9Q673_9CORY|nr:Rv3654c family TadE-like protein [Corynebacterium mycetoides]SDM06506.1 helicase/secretion neighborhood TadE-like protein [Corynebacterium mycetoides]
MIVRIWNAKRRWRPRDDRGYATVTSAGVIAAVMGLFLVVAAAGARVADTHRAQAAADLSAVAGAQAHYQGADACRVAAETAAANAAALTACELSGGDVIVAAAVGGAEARARAGPL